jgi:catechol 2,3-dioxygenase-like lactoylglutathione lyase family enzyme
MSPGHQTDTMDWTLEVVILPVSDLTRAIEFYRDRVGCQVFDESDGGTFLGFCDPAGNTWAVPQNRARADRPLIPLEHRSRFGAEA